MNWLWLWPIIGIILAVRKRIQLGRPLLVSTYIGLTLM